MVYCGRVAPNGNLNVNVKLRIDNELALALTKLALAGDRTVAAEMRRALRAHVEASESATDHTPGSLEAVQ